MFLNTKKFLFFPTVPTILENSADFVGAFLVIVNFPAPKLPQKPSKLDKKKALKILSESRKGPC